MGIVVAIDGPSGSGKSSVSLAVARQLQLAYLDTGAMYRAAAWWCEHLGIDLEDQEGVSDAVISMPLHMDTNPDHPGLSVDGIDIAQAIREPHISAVVSKIAANRDGRAELGRRQRELIEHGAANGGIVAEGRDITTVIAPDAQVRLLITASEEARLERRAAQLEAAGKSVDAAALRDQVLRRDRDDAKVSQFLEAPEGVTLVDTSNLDFNQSVEKVSELVRAAIEEDQALGESERLRTDAMRATLSESSQSS